MSFLERFLGPRVPENPVNPEQKEWVEQRFLWLKDHFGAEPIRRSPLVPGCEVLPKKWVPSYEAGDDLFKRLCRFMRVDPGRLDLYYLAENEVPRPLAAVYESESSGPAGLFIHPEDQNRLVIALDESGLMRPTALVATICHELAHVHLLADKRIDPKCEDCEPLTDLMTVYFGAGVFTANEVFQFNQWQTSNYGGWNASRLGYLSEDVASYALACYSWFRGEIRPPWAVHLRHNISHYLLKSIKFLEATKDTKVPFGGIANITPS